MGVSIPDQNPLSQASGAQDSAKGVLVEGHSYKDQSQKKDRVP